MRQPGGYSLNNYSVSGERKAAEKREKLLPAESCEPCPGLALPWDAARLYLKQLTPLR